SPGRVRSIVRRLLDEVRAAQRYRVPREAASDFDDARLVHADLAALSEQALCTEEGHVQQALAERDRLFHERVWLAERRGRLRAYPTSDSTLDLRPAT